MNKIDEIKAKIKQSGLKRIKVELIDIDIALSYFKDIMKTMLEVKQKELEWDKVKEAVRYMVEWTYLIGDHDFNKGFLFKGDTGRGKSFLFKAWIYFLSIDNVKFLKDGVPVLIKPLIVTAKQISGEYSSQAGGGYDVIKKYSLVSSLMIDDIGTESDCSVNFGNKINVIEEIINIRESEGLLTFGTANIGKMSDVYDSRIVSRMHSIFSVKPINHDVDFRTK